MTRKKVSVELIGEILPDQIYRTTLSPAIFGYGKQRTDDLVRTGEGFTHRLEHVGISRRGTKTIRAVVMAN
jgi:hypothetical protein